MSELDKRDTDFEISETMWLRWIQQDGVRVGALFFHQNPQTKEQCLGTVYFKNHPTEIVKWQFNGNFEKPSIFPSIRCLTCGTHGYVDDGKWRDA